MNKEYMYIVDNNIEMLSRQVVKLQRKTRGLKFGLFLTVVGGIYVTDKLVKVTAIHIKEIKQLQKEIDFLKGDKE